MKVRKSYRMAKKILLGVFAMVMVFTLKSNAKKIVFLNSTVVPAAVGFVKVKRDDNKNYNIKIEVSDLAEVGRLQTGKLTYVAWMETDNGNMENLGQVKSTTSLFSKQHKAFLETVSSFKPSKIFITTENDINVRYPDRLVILTTDNF